MNVPIEETDLAALGEWLVNETLKVLTEIRGIEYRINIMDYMAVPPERITFGTADAWGYDGTILTLVDVKSGKERDYKEQMACYALGLMDEQREEKCQCVVLYCDIPGHEKYTFSLKEAEQIVFGIIARVVAGVEEPQENDYCRWCAKKLTCPVWVIPAEQALEIVNNKTFDLESLKQDPVRLGEFWDKWTKAKTLVEEHKLRECALTWLNADKDSVPGWKVSPVNRFSYSEEETMDLLECMPELGIQRMAECLSVSREKFEKAWKEVSKDPVPVEPSIHVTYQKLLRK